MTHRLAHPSRIAAAALTAGAISFLSAPAPAQVQTIGADPESKNMRVVGFHDLQARSAYQPTIARQGNRYILYVGHHGSGGADAPRAIDPLTRQAELGGVLDGDDPLSERQVTAQGVEEGGLAGAGAPADDHVEPSIHGGRQQVGNRG